MYGVDFNFFWEIIGLATQKLLMDGKLLGSPLESRLDIFAYSLVA